MKGHATVSVGKWGNSLAMRLNKELERGIGVGNGDKIDVEYTVSNNVVVLQLKKSKPASPRYTLKELMAGCAKAKRPVDAWAGLKPVGREKP